MERQAPTAKVSGDVLTLQAARTVVRDRSRIAAAIDAELGDGTAQAVDGGSVTFKVGDDQKKIQLVCSRASEF